MILNSSLENIVYGRPTEMLLKTELELGYTNWQMILLLSLLYSELDYYLAWVTCN